MRQFENKALAPLTTIDIGGTAERFYEPENISEVQELLARAGKLNSRLHILGGGSNLLVSDDRVSGWFVKFGEQFSQFNFAGNHLRARAGAGLAKIVTECARRGLSGFEWAAGLPATVGGAVAMNAGAFGTSMADKLQWVRVVDRGGSCNKISREDLELSYRESPFPEDGVIVEAQFSLAPKETEVVREILRKNHRRRRQAQPLGDKSAGSVFKNPPGESAGALIDAAGLKGLRENNAMISEKHANFIINCGGASFADVLRLIKRVRHRISNNYDIDLELELKIIE